MKTNYHTHTYRCKHAVGDDEAYVLSAIAAGFDLLGFADHCPWPFASDYRSGIRMEPDMLDDYIYNISSLREKYKDRITIKIGLECEYFEEYIPWLTTVAAQKGLDYLIFGNHFAKSEETGSRYFGNDCATPERLEEYRASALAGINSGVFSYMAHPDLFMHTYPAFDERAEQVTREICRAAAIMDLPLEFNISGFRLGDENGRGFPHPDFWRIAAEEGNRAIIGVDAHSHTALQSHEDYARAIAILDQLHIERIETL